MSQHKIEISIEAKNELEARQVQQALENISKTFRAQELVLIAKKLEMPLIKLRIRSML